MQKIQQPELISYAATKDEISSSIKAGIHHLILDDASISIRSWQEPKLYDNLDGLIALVNWTKETYPDVVVSVNCDGLYHSNEALLLADLDNLIHSTNLDFLRVQDVGILQYMHKKCKCILDMQMGNCNWVSVAEFKKLAKRQVVSMDVSYKDTCEINAKVGANLECYVHSRVLLQYSKRRFMLGNENQDEIKNPNLTQIYKLAQDEDYPGRRFSFLDNSHGHFMFAYFDRCLLRCINELIECDFSGWIIDNRGCDWDYHLDCINVYADILKNYSQAYDIRNKLNELSKRAPRPLKPGFFKINQTDNRRYKKINMFALDDEAPVAKVLDAQKKKRLTLEVIAPISVGDVLIARHPKIDDCKFELNTLWDLNDVEITSAQAGMLVQVPWQKYIQQQAVIVRKI